MKLDAIAGVPAALVGESNRRGVVVLLHGLGDSWAQATGAMVESFERFLAPTH